MMMNNENTNKNKQKITDCYSMCIYTCMYGMYVTRILMYDVMRKFCSWDYGPIHANC